jgi:transposase-like protein
VARYGKAFKDRAVARLLAPESSPVQTVAQALGVSVATLERWRADALSEPGREQVWTAAARLQAVIATAAMDEAQRSAWCREHGVYATQLLQWTDDATAALGESREERVSPQSVREDRKRIKELERELRRKDRALAEAAALLVLSKKMEAIFQRAEDE